jgi:hypothetical protein
VKTRVSNHIDFSPLAMDECIVQWARKCIVNAIEAQTLLFF